jgi:hypothetical protein
VSGSSITAEDRRSLTIQRWVGRLTAPLWVPVCVAIMHLGLRWRFRGAGEARREYRRLRSESDAPILICANHLTMLDSFAIAFGLGTAWTYVVDYGALPWNTPEREHFASTWWKRALVYVMKCVPVDRGGDRRAVGKTLNRVLYVMSTGEAALVFPEGGRSRTSRVDTEAVTYGVGRLVKNLPGCRVLCVYLRGDGQDVWTDAPARGETFDIRVRSFEPKSDHGGMRASIDISSQILNQLAEMEQEYFDGRQ